MLPGFILSLREGLEVALVIGIILGALRTINRTELFPIVWRGVIAASLTSLLAAVGLTWLGAEFQGQAEQIFEGVSMLLAAGLLSWMILWMQHQAGMHRQELEQQVHHSATRNSQLAMFGLAFVMVIREGLELALFLFAAGLATNLRQTALGAVLGLACAGSLGAVLFLTTRKLSLKHFFRITNILLIIFAAGLVAHGIHEFNEARLVPAIVEHVWDTTSLLDEKSTLGQLLSVLIGYNAQPSLAEIVAYLAYFILLFLTTRYFHSRISAVQSYKRS